MTGPKYASIITLHKKVNIYLKIYIDICIYIYIYIYIERERERERERKRDINIEREGKRKKIERVRKKRERMRYMSGKRTSPIVLLKVFSVALATFSKYFATTTEGLAKKQ